MPDRAPPVRVAASYISVFFCRPPVVTNLEVHLLEIRVIAAENEALQALGISKNICWNAFPLRFHEIDQSISCARDVRFGRDGGT